MSGDGSRNLEQNIKEERSYSMSVIGLVCKPLWLRHNTILADSKDWEFMARQCRFVCYSGLFFWAVFILSQKI